MDQSRALPSAIARLRELGVDVAGDADLAATLTALQQRIVAVVTVEASAFDQPLYDELMRLWGTINAERLDHAD